MLLQCCSELGSQRLDPLRDPLQVNLRTGGRFFSAQAPAQADSRRRGRPRPRRAAALQRTRLVEDQDMRPRHILRVVQPELLSHRKVVPYWAFAWAAQPLRGTGGGPGGWRVACSGA